jgi:hypothetical protein
MNGGSTTTQRRRRTTRKGMKVDLDRLIEVRVLPYDPERAKDALEGLVDLLLDAQRQRELRAIAECSQEPCTESEKGT